MTGPFSREELRARGDRARGVMEREGLDALIVTGDFSAGSNYYYLSGHMPRDYQLNFSRPHVMVLPREGEPFLFIYGVNAENARGQGWVDDIASYSANAGTLNSPQILREIRLAVPWLSCNSQSWYRSDRDHRCNSASAQWLSSSKKTSRLIYSIFNLKGKLIIEGKALIHNPPFYIL